MRNAMLWSCLVVTGLALPARVDAQPPGPLPAQVRDLVHGSAEDVLDKKPCEPTATRKNFARIDCRDAGHYVRSNEWNHQVFRPYITGLGGGFIGVGSDQSFTLVAWQHAEIAFLFDYDPDVVRMNMVQRAFIEHSPDIATYMSRYKSRNRREARAILEREYADHPDRANILYAFRHYRGKLERHHKRVMRHHKRASHFLHDDADYQYLHEMAANDRIRVLKGDLLKSTTLTGVSRITQELSLPMRVIYTSNAEDFWNYPQAFRDNFSGMLMDDRTVVLRTRFSDVYGPRLDRFVYVVQDGLDFRTRLADPTQRNVGNMMRSCRTVPGQKGLLTVGEVQR